jgi:hypothetical protein
MSPAEALEVPAGPTGPRTPEGKSTSAKNALKTGLYTAQNFVLPNELTDTKPPART